MPRKATGGMSAADERKQRLMDLLWTVREHGGRVLKRQLVTAACRAWPVSRDTAEGYVEAMVDMEYLGLDFGTTVWITKAGAEALAKVVNRPLGPLPGYDAMPPAGDQRPSTPPRAAPSPPMQTGSEVEQNAGIGHSADGRTD